MQTQIGAHSLLMNRFPFLPFLKLQSVTRKPFLGMAAGWFTGSTRNFLQRVAKPSCCPGQIFPRVIKEVGERASLYKVQRVAHSSCRINIILWDDLICQMTSGFCSSLIGGGNKGTQEVSFLVSSGSLFFSFFYNFYLCALREVSSCEWTIIASCI